MSFSLDQMYCAVIFFFLFLNSFIVIGFGSLHPGTGFSNIEICVNFIY